jgi:hypothetical protein
VIALPVLLVVRVIGVFMFAAGAGALVAGIVSRLVTISVNAAWAASLLGFALTLAFVFISASGGAALLMPAQTALVRDIRGERILYFPRRSGCCSWCCAALRHCRCPCCGCGGLKIERFSTSLRPDDPIRSGWS